MDNETVTLRSSILPGLMRRTLFRGTLVAGGGVCLLLVVGALLQLQYMKLWGAAVFLIGIALITLGLLPYKRLKKLEEKPSTLTVDQTALHYSSKGKIRFSIPIVSIARLDYMPEINSSIQQATEAAGQANEYGIKIFLNKPLKEKVIVQDPHFDFSRFSQQSLARHGSDLFLPYFSPRTYKTLEELLSMPCRQNRHSKRNRGSAKEMMEDDVQPEHPPK